MTVSYIKLMRAQQKRHDLPQSPARSYETVAAMREGYAIAKARLWQRPGARPGANMPRNGTTPYRTMRKAAVDFDYAMLLVCEDQQITPSQMMLSGYSAAIAARHMLWTVLLDGGHTVANICTIFGADHATVRKGIRTFRDFQQGQV